MYKSDACKSDDGNLMNLMCSYLKNRKQRVQINPLRQKIVLSVFDHFVWLTLKWLTATLVLQKLFLMGFRKAQ